MHKRKKLLPYLLLGIISFITLLFFFIFIDPEKNTNVGLLQLSPVLFFFLLTTVFSFSLGTYVFGNIRLGLLTSLFLTSALFLRFISYTSYIYIGILLVIVILLELGFRKK